jgi:DNA-nicking Smr family endonuclease
MRGIFRARNAGSRVPAEVDLHGLHVDEAVRIVAALIARLQRSRARSVFTIITGAGHHSQGADSRVRRAIVALLRRRGLRFVSESPGALRVALQ